MTLPDTAMVSCLQESESTMIRCVLLSAVLGAAMLLASCVGPLSGNDTGGIIAWSPEAEAAAPQIAMQQCAGYGKEGRVSSVTRGYGNYIAYSCRWTRFRPAY